MPETPSESTNSHRQSAGESLRSRTIRCAIATVSDTRTPETDEGGRLIRDLLTQPANGQAVSPFSIMDATIIKDEADAIEQQLHAWICRTDIDVIFTTGGTGIARRDTTIEVVERFLTARLDGFGEIFRMLSYSEVGAAAMLSRATGGLVAREEADGGDTFIFAVPGSKNAIHTAFDTLLLRELPHLMWERKR